MSSPHPWQPLFVVAVADFGVYRILHNPAGIWDLFFQAFGDVLVRSSGCGKEMARLLPGLGIRFWVVDPVGTTPRASPTNIRVEGSCPDGNGLCYSQAADQE